MRCEQVVYLASDGGMQSARGSRDGLIDRFVRCGRLKVPVLVEVAAKELKQLRVLITGPHNASIAPPPLSSAFAWKRYRIARNGAVRLDDIGTDSRAYRWPRRCRAAAAAPRRRS
jgi:hypothetical protein